MRFCQQIEGRQKEVLTLIKRISSDTRLANVTIFHHGQLKQCRFKNFSLAFSDVDGIDVLAKLEKLGDQASVTAFTELLATLELDGQQPSRFKPGARSTSLYRVQPSRCAGF